ncbi:MAG TPA: transposase [Segetibacter sp.]|jgi:transposase
MKKIFVGIDVSKKWIDVCVTIDGKEVFHNQFGNCLSGFKAMLKWLKEYGKAEDLLLCMEHTGIYAQPLWFFLTEKKIIYCVVAGAVISSGLEIRRGKNDKIDARDIARFALRYADELKPHRLPAQLLRRLKMFFSYRDRLVKAKMLISVPAKEAKEYAGADSKEVRSDSNSLVQVIQSRIDKVEKLMLQVINSDDQTAQYYKLIVSVPGFGLVTASYLLIITQSFTTLQTSRKAANFGGTAPHPHKSGTSIRGKTRVSPVADKKLKTLLSNGTSSRLQYDLETQQYFARMLQRGKDENLVKNNIKNKMLHTVYAVVKRGTPYIKNYVSLLNQ